MKTAFSIACFCLLPGCSTLASREAVVACQAADAGTTVYAMELGARELNPVVGAMLTALGPAGFVAAKAGVTLFLLHVHSSVPTGVMALANGITCAAAANNTKVIRELQNKPSETRKETGRGGEI